MTGMHDGDTTIFAFAHQLCFWVLSGLRVIFSYVKIAMTRIYSMLIRCRIISTGIEGNTIGEKSSKVLFV